jgi:PAS domain S-box-containing protein
MQHGKKTGKQLPGKPKVLEDRNNVPDATEMNCEQAEEALMKSQTILRNIFESSPDLLSVLDKDLRIIHSNWHGGYEYVPEEIRSQKPLCYDTHYPGQNAPCTPCHVLEVFASGKPAVAEKFNPRTGQLEAHAYPLFDDSGNVALVVEHVSNITGRKKMEEELRKARDELEKRVVERTRELNYKKRQLEKQNIELRRTQKELEISRNRYANLYDFAPLGYVTITAKGIIHEANLTIARLLGVDRSVLIGRSFRHYVVERDVQKFHSHLNLLKQADEPATTELGIRLKSKGLLEVRLYSVPVKDFGRQDIFYRTAVTNITDEKQAEDSLRESEKHFRQLVEHSPVAMAVFCGTDRRVPLVNRKFTELFGYTTADVPDVSLWWSVAYPDDEYREAIKAEWNAKVEQAVTNRCEIESMEARVTCKDGFVRHVEIGLSSIGERNLVTFIDLTESRKAEEAIRQSEKKFRTLFEESKDIVFIVDAHGRLLDINPACTEILGYTKKELLALNPAHDLHVSSTAKEQFMKLLMNTGFVNDYELELQRKDGRKAIVHITASLTRNDEGTISGYRGIAHDVTERKKLEQQLLQGQKLQSIGLLAGGVAHDFNNLLTAISGYGQIIQDNIPANDELLHESIEQVLKAAQRAAELTRNLLAFSRKQVINPKPVLVDSIIRNADKLIQGIIGEDIELCACSSCKPLLAMADAGQIEQVLMNLATNARDAMPGGGILRISSQKAIIKEGSEGLYDLPSSGKYAMISISDTGSGIDETAVERIFEPFYTTKEVGKGTGLGLSISHGIIKQHDGSILVKSEPGKGTTFTIYLPLAGEQFNKAKKHKPSFSIQTK